MSTAAYIAIELPHQSGLFNVVYCNSDGDPDRLGRMLREHYNTPEILDELMDLGDLSYLESSLENSRFYGRDQGEPASETASFVMNAGGLLRRAAQIDYVYMFRGGQWTCYNPLRVRVDIPA